MGAEKGLIFGSMAAPSWDFLIPYRHWPDVVIAADGGLQRAREAGFSPRVFIGDGDSGGKAEGAMEAVLLPPEKDVTDLQAAFEWARDHGLKELLLAGCTGGRQDHQLAALSLLELTEQAGMHGILLDPWNQIEFLLPGRYELKQTEYDYFSLLPVDRLLEGVTIEGAKYPLKDHRVRRGDSLTVSNEWKAPIVHLSIEAGCCYLIRSKK